MSLEVSRLRTRMPPSPIPWGGRAGRRGGRGVGALPLSSFLPHAIVLSLFIFFPFTVVRPSLLQASELTAESRNPPPPPSPSPSSRLHTDLDPQPLVILHHLHIWIICPFPCHLRGRVLLQRTKCTKHAPAHRAGPTPASVILWMVTVFLERASSPATAIRMLRSRMAGMRDLFMAAAPAAATGHG